MTLTYLIKKFRFYTPLFVSGLLRHGGFAEEKSRTEGDESSKLSDAETSILSSSVLHCTAKDETTKYESAEFFELPTQECRRPI
jgi:hypothetical protein